MTPDHRVLANRLTSCLGVLGLLLAGSAGCFDPSASVCSSGTAQWYCPGDMACHPNVRCVSMEQVAACVGKDDLAGCDTAQIPEGRCVFGACLPAMCGDGVKDEDEECDDGPGNSDTEPNACREDCHPARCGDGVIDNEEECDDASGLSDTLPDACRSDCVLPFCGDDVLDRGEACDNGPDNSDTQPNACREDCQEPRCGDGVPDGTEQCDDGGANSNVLPDACRTDCSDPACGDAVQDSGEECDDGNILSGDGCRGDCLKEEVCGDGVRDEGEACDDGNLNPADGCDACVVTAWSANALVGRSAADATAVAIGYPSGVAIDRLGNLYFTDEVNHRIRRLDAMTGFITTVAGTATRGFSGDGDVATSAQLDNPYGIAVDGLGNLFIADSWNQRIRRIEATTGIITTVAGTGTSGFSGDGGAATGAQLSYPSDVAVDGLGNIFIADAANHRIRRVDADSGVITTIAGTGTYGYSGDDGDATSAQLDHPFSVAVDSLGRVFVADRDNHRIRQIDAATGIITTVAGTGTRGFSGDGGQATSAQLNSPFGVTVDGLGNLFIADTDGDRIRRMDAATGVIMTVAGAGTRGFSGDGGSATSAQLDIPKSVVVDGLGNLFIADTQNGRIRKVDEATGTITTVAGMGAIGFIGDDGAATSAQLRSPADVAVDGLGNIFVADSNSNRIRRIDAATGIITTVAGTGTPGFSGDGAAATAAQLQSPRSVAVDSLGILFVADTLNHRIRRVDTATGVITTVAGNGTLGFSGDGGSATSAQIYQPYGVAVDGQGNLFIADSINKRIRRVDAATGFINTIAGTGTSGFSGDGGEATSANIGTIWGIAVDGFGNVFIADSNNNRIRRIDTATGIINTVAGSGPTGFGNGGYSGDGGAATSAQLNSPHNVAVDGIGNLFIADSYNYRIRRVDVATGVINTITGSGVDDFSGDRGAAYSAQISSPRGLTVDGSGGLIFGDTDGHVRRVDAATGVINTVAGQVDPEGMGPRDQAKLTDPRALVMATSLTVVAGGSTGTVQVVRDASWLEAVIGRYPHSPATGNFARYRDQTFGAVTGVAFDAAAGRIYLTESSENRLHVVTVVDADDADTWTISTLANEDGIADFADGLALTARFRQPTGLYLDEVSQILYVADTGNHAIRAIDLSGGVAAATATTVAGTPDALGFFGDGGNATDALLYIPQAITLCDNGDLFIADTGNHRVRRVEAITGVITTVLGDGVAASSGQGAPSDTFPANSPLGLDCDSFGNLYVSSTTTVRLVLADYSGIVDGTGEVQTIFGAQPRDTFPASAANCLTGIAVVDDETVQVADSCVGVLVELTREPVP